MIRHFLLIVFCIISTTLAQAGEWREYPLPLKMIPRVSGTFGEFRRNHIHQGLDLRTFAQNGIRIYSPADAWIKSIHASNINSGFGQAIYLKHRDGYSSVYGHLMRFHSLHQLQAAFELYQLMTAGDYFMIHMPEGWLPVRRGEFFAYTGDKGSGLSHLHYEIISPRGDYLNPFPSKQHGAADKKAPSIVAVFVHHLDKLTNGQRTHRCSAIVTEERLFRCSEPLPVDGLFALKISAADTINAINTVAIYRADVLLEGKRIFQLVLDAMKPEDSRNTFLLYDRLRTRFAPPLYTYNLFLPQQQSENLPAYVKEQINKGWIDTSDWAENEIRQIRIILSDISGNTSSVELTVQKKSAKQPEQTRGGSYNLNPGQSPDRQAGELTIYGTKLNSKAFLSISTAKAGKLPGLQTISKKYTIKFYSLSGREKIEACIRSNRQQQRGLYNSEGALLSGIYQPRRKGYCTTLTEGATLLVADDHLPPTISQPYTYGPLGQSQLTLAVYDGGSGIKTNQIDLVLGGYLLTEDEKVRIGLYYDRDRKGFVLNTGFMPDASRHQQGKPIPLQVRVYDNAGNASSWFRGFIYIPQ